MSGFGCISCKYSKRSVIERPCSSCKCGNDHGSKWEPKEERIATPPSGVRNDNVGGAVDMVNKPPHYTHGKYECIDVMVETFGKEVTEHFCLLNAFKYIWRSEHKNGLEDIKKAWWYLDKYLELEGEKHE